MKEGCSKAHKGQRDIFPKEVSLEIQAGRSYGEKKAGHSSPREQIRVIGRKQMTRKEWV